MEKLSKFSLTTIVFVSVNGQDDSTFHVTSSNADVFVCLSLDVPRVKFKKTPLFQWNPTCTQVFNYRGGSFEDKNQFIRTIKHLI